MHLLNATTSTDPAAPQTVRVPGDYKVMASIPSGDAASIALEERINDTGEWVPLADRQGTQVVLTYDAPSAVLVLSGGQQIRATRTGGSAAVSVILSDTKMF